MRELVVGERVLVEGGTRVVQKVAPRGEEVVYNIEVEGDHCYRVGEQGVLVHNASFAKPKDPCACSSTVFYARLPEVFFGAGGAYTAVVKKGSYRKTNPICRVDIIAGPIKLLPEHSRGPGNAQDRMRRFFFEGSGAEQTQARVKYDAGHLIADSLGGPDDERNLVRLVSKLNRSGGAWYAMEEHIRRCLPTI